MCDFHVAGCTMRRAGWRNLGKPLAPSCRPDGGLTALWTRLARQYAGCHDRDIPCCRPYRSRPRRRADRARARDSSRAHGRVGADVRARRGRDARRRAVPVPEERPVAGLRPARHRRPRVGRRRQRVPGLPQRLRRHVRRSRQPRHRRRRQGADGRGHPLRRPDRGLDRRRRGAAAPLGSPPLALHQLRHRVDDGRDPPRPRGDRPRPDRQDRGHLPRPPRRRDGLRQAARRADGRPRAPRLGPVRPRLPRRHDRPDAGRAVQRRRRDRAGPLRARRAASPA